MYVPLHWHSTFSFLEALGQPKDIVKHAKELWLPAIAITDYNGMFGIPSFFVAAKNSKNPDDENDQWVKAIFGSEIWFVMDIKSMWALKDIWNICFLAQTDKWYHNMLELVAYANQDWLTNGKAKVDLNILREKSEWIIVFMWWNQSWISKLLQSWESEENITEMYSMLHDFFKDKCYLEIAAQNESLIPEVKRCNKFVYNLSKQTNTKIIVDNNYHYIRKEDRKTWEVALAVKDWAKMYDQNRRNPMWEYHIMQEEEIKNICIKNWYNEWEINEWIQNNWNVAQMIDAKILFDQKLFPKYETPDHIRELYNKYGDELIGE